MSKENTTEWIIKPETSWFAFNFREIAAYKDLLFRLVRKEFLSSYQQTLLGPFWILLQPLLTVITYVLIFNKVIGLSTEGIPSFLYYLTGITLWTFFSELFLNTAYTFNQNIGIYSKVYFPRLIVPISMLLLNGIRLGIQLLLLFAALAYYCISQKVTPDFSNMLLAIPAIIITAGIGFGGGLFFAVITAKYKDLLGLLQLFIRLLMFVCPIFFSLNMVPQKIQWVVNVNPLSAQFELFRYSFLGTGQFQPINFLYSVCAMLVILFAGIAVFNKMGDKLMDVI